MGVRVPPMALPLKEIVMKKINLWLDDIRDPVQHGYVGWTWVKTYDAAIALLKTGNVEVASLDHDLSLMATLGYPDKELTGYDVVCWMEENNVWPSRGCYVHSANPVGKQRMELVLRKYNKLIK